MQHKLGNHLMEHEVEIVDRKDIPEDYLEWMDKESHHDHLIVRDKNGTLRWKETPNLHSQATDKCGHMSEIMQMFQLLGWSKNSEQVREFYRKIGYSLSGYWEIFHWRVNNPDRDNYVQKIQTFAPLPNKPLDKISPAKFRDMYAKEKHQYKDWHELCEDLSGKPELMLEAENEVMEYYASNVQSETEIESKSKRYFFVTHSVYEKGILTNTGQTTFSTKSSEYFSLDELTHNIISDIVPHYNDMDESTRADLNMKIIVNNIHEFKNKADFHSFESDFKIKKQD